VDFDLNGIQTANGENAMLFRREMCRIVLTGLLLVLGNCDWATAADVQLIPHEDTVEVNIGDTNFATYNFGEKWPKPFLYPVKTETGKLLTRSLEAPDSKDHPHHKGVWCAIDEVNDIKFWAEKGKIQTKSVEAVTAKGNPAVLKVTNHWVNAEGEPVVIEVEKISIYADRVVTYDLTFTAGKDKVTWGDTKEGLFGIRVADTMRESKGGEIVNAEGLRTTKACWGKLSDWVDYTGEVGGEKAGVALFDHPENFRRSRYHVRDYGLFTLSPFGTHSYTNGAEPANPLVQEPGMSFRLQYGLYFHPGDAAAGGVSEKYKAFLERTSAK